MYILEILSNYVKMPYHALIRAFAAVYFSKDFFAILNINIKKFRLQYENFFKTYIMVEIQKLCENALPRSDWRLCCCLVFQRKRMRMKWCFWQTTAFVYDSLPATSCLSIQSPRSSVRPKLTVLLKTDLMRVQMGLMRICR